MSFLLYDIAFLVLFVVALVVFLYKNKKNIKRQGLLYLYPTRIGINLIEKFTKRYEKILRPMQYVIVASGYFLMVAIIWLFGKLCYTYLFSPTLARDLKVPVITPLVPYIDQLLGSSYFPPFYFTTWIIVIAIIAISHEFAHGIFARLNKITVHSTGFGFLGPFLAAFVEPDEKQMEKAKKFPQLAILAAGTFANILMTILFGLIMFLFFLAAFTPAGVFFSSYALSSVSSSDISQVNGINLDDINLSSFSANKSLISLSVKNVTYFTTSESFLFSKENNLNDTIIYDNSPAFKANLSGAIYSIDGEKLTSYTSLKSVLLQHSPGDFVKITTINNKVMKNQTLQLAEKDGKPFLGIAVSQNQNNAKGIVSKAISSFYKFIDPIKYRNLVDSLNFESKIGDIGFFIYNLLWWIVIINFSVALFNMLPAGIFDGGRFFYLTIWGITGSKKIGERAFKIATWIIILLFLAMIVKWIFAFS